MFKKLCVRPIIISVLLGLFFCNTAYATGYKLPDGEVLNDPTKPHNWNKVSQPKAQQKHFALNYILKTSARTNAIINGKNVTEGETVSGAKVLKINQSTVLILVDGKRRTLHLNKGGSIRK